MFQTIFESKWLQGFITAILYVIVCFTWGTTWIGIEKAVETIPPLTAAGVRFVIAFPLFVLIARLKKEPLLYPKNKRTFLIFIIIFYFSIPYFLISYGEQYVSSGLSALIFSSMPVFMLIFSVLFLKEKIIITQVAGIAIGFFSLIMILMGAGENFTYDNFIGALAILVAAVLHGLCYVLTKKKGADISVITFNAIPIGVAGMAMLVLGGVTEDIRIHNISNESILALIYLGIVASVGGFIVYFYLLKRLSPVVVSFVFIIFPVFAVVIDAFYNNEVVSSGFRFYAFIMLFGFALTKLNFELNSFKLTVVKQEN